MPVNDSERLNALRPTPRRKLASAAAVVTLAAFAWALYARQVVPADPDFPFMPIDELLDANFRPGGIGVVVQLAILPIALIYFVSNTSSFRQMIGGKATPRDRFKSFGLLALIQMLTFGYHLGVARFLNEPPELGIVATVDLVMIVGGLLGGWKMGLGLGVVSMLLRGTRTFLCVLPHISPEFPLLLETKGLLGLVYEIVKNDLIRHYFINLASSSALWAGTVSGLCAELLGKHRLAPLATLFLGVGIEAGTAALMIIGRAPPVIEFLFPGTLMTGLTMVIVALIVRGREMETAQRQAEAAHLALTQAELRALRAQINPHFLFNALNTIRYFVRTDPETARRLLLNLSEIFQRALRSGEFVPLQDELNYVASYLALEKARFDQRLHVEWPEPPADLLDYPVPTLILQPIVENAVVHGIAPRTTGGTVRISITQAQNILSLQVEDDGPGIDADQLAELLSPEPDNNGAIGLRNVDLRLRTLYGEAYKLIVESEVGHGKRVQIRIPMKGGHQFLERAPK